MSEMARYVDVDIAHIYVSEFVCEQMKKIPTEDVVKVKNLTPCDVCGYNPPSSFDGKPCAMCPATKKRTKGE